MYIMTDSDDENFYWFYQSDHHTSTSINWTLYHNSNDLIENAYQEFLFAKEQNNLVSNVFNLDDEMHYIDFNSNIQRNYKDKSKERIVGRFQGDPMINTNLKNSLSFEKNRWYSLIEDNTWAPYRIDDSATIENKYIDYYLSKGPASMEGDYYVIDFVSMLETSKLNSKLKKVGRFKECPESLTRINYYNNEIKPQKSSIVTIDEQSVKSINKDYYLRFKNIFPTNNHETKQKMIYYYNSVDQSVILQMFSGWNSEHVMYLKTNEEDILTCTLIKKLEDEGYRVLCKVNRNHNTDCIDFKMKEFPTNMMRSVFKTNWFYKLDEKCNHLWKQYSIKLNSNIDLAYKHNFLVIGEEAVELGTDENFIKINFTTNKEERNNQIATIMRFNLRNAFPDNIHQLIVPEEIFNMISEANDKLKYNDHQQISLANKFGPKSFKELINAIRSELKTEAEKIALEKEFNAYDRQYIQTINSKNFVSKIIMIYTEEGFVYRRINKVLRDKDYDLFWDLKYYYFSLLFALQKTFSDKDLNYLYRGMKLKAEQADFYKKLVKGQMIHFYEFLSTTYNIDIALKYAKTGEGSCLFEIEVPKEENMLRLSKIEHFSRFEHEKEVLLSSGSILLFDECKDENDFTKIRFKLISSNYQAFSNFVRSYNKNSLNLSTISFDLKGLNHLFESLNNNKTIEELDLTIYDRLLISYFAQIVSKSSYLNYVKITKEGEINNT